jgi:hypothetical protein
MKKTITGWDIRGDGMYLMAVKMNLIENNYAKNPGDIIFYEPDEPMGHAYPEDRLLTKQEAYEELLWYVEQFKYTPENLQEITLEDFRKKAVLSLNKGREEQDYVNLDRYKPKERYRHWFTIQDIWNGKIQMKKYSLIYNGYGIEIDYDDVEDVLVYINSILRCENCKDLLNDRYFKSYDLPYVNNILKGICSECKFEIKDTEEYLRENENFYVALQLTTDYTVIGIKTEDDAWQWIAENGICRECKEDLSKGYEEHDLDGEIIKDEVDHPFHTSCGVEWMVLLLKDYLDCETLEDYFKDTELKKNDKFE